MDDGVYRISTWNVNSIRQRLEHLRRFTENYQPSVLCLQETKVVNDDFPAEEIKQMGYQSVFIHGQKSYNGVAILARMALQATERKVWCERDDCRHIAVTLPNGVALHNFYVPSGGPVPDPRENDRFAHKIQFLQEMADWAAGPNDSKQPMILVGDMNVAPLENDVWNHKRLLKSVGHTPLESNCMAELAERGNLIDVGRHFVPSDKPLYSWWGYRYKLSVEKNYGWRLDHILASRSLEPKLKSFHVAKDMRLWEKPSDHVPLLLDLEA